MIEKNDFETFARSKLDETVDKMDGATRTRLATMRRSSVASNRPRRGWWLPVSLASAVMALVLLWMMPQQSRNEADMATLEPAATEDLDLLASDVAMDLIEDIEFYQWLNDGDHAG